MKNLKLHAYDYARKQLGEDQFKANTDAVNAILEHFLAGVECFKKLQPDLDATTLQWKEKAEKWDRLDEKISKCYPEYDDHAEENDDDDYDNTDLGTIGELAASAFGYL